MLSITGLSKTYRNGVCALHEVSLDVPAGLFGLLGPNGAGKSTLMRTIATLQTPDAGTITLGGIDVLSDKVGLRRRLGYLPQEFGAPPRTSPRLLLSHFAALKGIHGRDRTELVDDLLARTNLWEVRDRSIDTFSGGMKQRFGIAQALIGRPSLVIVDEPTAGLDPAERRRFQNLLATVAEDVVVILSTHIVDDVAGICSRMAIMGGGRILLEGRPRELTEALVGRLWCAASARGEETRPPEGGIVLSRRFVDGGTQVRVLSESRPEGMEAAAPTLEDVYFASLHEHGLDAEVD